MQETSTPNPENYTRDTDSVDPTDHIIQSGPDVGRMQNTDIAFAGATAENNWRDEPTAAGNEIVFPGTANLVGEVGITDALAKKVDAEMPAGYDDTKVEAVHSEVFEDFYANKAEKSAEQKIAQPQLLETPQEPMSPNENDKKE